MKMRFLLTVVLLLTNISFAHATKEKLGVTFEVSYLTKWLSKGAEAYGQQGALFKSFDLDFYGTGFGLNIKHRNATSSGYVDKERIDFMPYYKNKLFEDQLYATNYKLSVGYKYYPRVARHEAGTAYEWVLACSWPKILANGLVPKYIVHYEYPAGRNYTNHNAAGWAHRFGLDYDLNTPELPNPLHLSSEICYYDGIGGKSKDSDWAYTNFGISTKFKMTGNLTFTPGVYYQISMDDSVAKKDDMTYAILTMTYKLQ